jgi:hypothetical protein
MFLEADFSAADILKLNDCLPRFRVLPLVPGEVKGRSQKIEFEGRVRIPPLSGPAHPRGGLAGLKREGPPREVGMRMWRFFS